MQQALPERERGQNMYACVWRVVPRSRFFYDVLLLIYVPLLAREGENVAVEASKTSRTWRREIHMS